MKYSKLKQQKMLLIRKELTINKQKIQLGIHQQNYSRKLKMGKLSDKKMWNEKQLFLIFIGLVDETIY